ncbi:hypothetical protein HAX54_018012 [Datura stramonium]|uniref:Uncharacterized protein n=1 Tax=Datura stramonium TaxID=4076 RepID=A0ABS8UN62_DATST|nr:hypothetical protein [Datura stramonium]
MHRVSAIITGTCVEKKEDPGEFSMPCRIGEHDCLHDFYDNRKDDFVVLDCDVDGDISIILGRPFPARRKSLIYSEKHEIMFLVKDESITLKARRGHLLPKGVGDIFVVNVEKGVEEVAKCAIFASLKRKKANLTRVKQYLYGTKNRKWVRKSYPKDGSPGP